MKTMLSRTLICAACQQPIDDPGMANVEWNYRDPKHKIVLHKLCGHQWYHFHGKPDCWETLKDFNRSGSKV